MTYDIRLLEKVLQCHKRAKLAQVRNTDPHSCKIPTQNRPRYLHATLPLTLIDFKGPLEELKWILKIF